MLEIARVVVCAWKSTEERRGLGWNEGRGNAAVIRNSSKKEGELQKGGLDCGL